MDKRGGGEFELDTRGGGEFELAKPFSHKSWELCASKPRRKTRKREDRAKKKEPRKKNREDRAEKTEPRRQSQEDSVGEGQRLACLG